MKTIGFFNSIYEVKSLNRNSGYHWFPPSTLKWFNGKVYDVLYSGCVFVSSEKENSSRFTPYPQRQYSVRVAMSDGTINTYCNTYTSKREADKEARWLGKQLANHQMIYCNTTYNFVDAQQQIPFES